MVYLSQSAANEIRRLQVGRQQSDSYFRLGVRQGGCSGLYYTLEFCQEQQEGDRIYESLGISILVDEKSASYLQNIKLDFAEDLMGGSFRFQNPNAIATCGCALSFSCAA